MSHFTALKWSMKYSTTFLTHRRVVHENRIVFYATTPRHPSPPQFANFCTLHVSQKPRQSHLHDRTFPFFEKKNTSKELGKFSFHSFIFFFSNELISINSMPQWRWLVQNVTCRSWFLSSHFHLIWLTFALLWDFSRRQLVCDMKDEGIKFSTYSSKQYRWKRKKNRITKLPRTRDITTIPTIIIELQVVGVKS